VQRKYSETFLYLGGRIVFEDKHLFVLLCKIKGMLYEQFYISNNLCAIRDPSSQPFHEKEISTSQLSSQMNSSIAIFSSITSEDTATCSKHTITNKYQTLLVRYYERAFNPNQNGRGRICPRPV